MATQEELKYRIALTLLPQAGVKRAKEILHYFGCAERFFFANEQDLAGLSTIGKAHLNAMLNGKEEALKRAEQELTFIDKHNIETYCILDDNYPKRLAQCIDAPVLLYSKGNVNLEAEHMLSVVGTRQPSDRAKDWCRSLILELAERVPNLTIVSGLAYGIDVCAHKAALEAGIPTIIIPGHGLDRIYPSMHRSVAVQALEHGGILTEYLSGNRPEPQNFVARNRIVAGLSDATIVVESKEKGGSLITANMAFDYGREVFAVPGRPTDENALGCNNLIKRHKAAMIEHADDLLFAMQWKAKAGARIQEPTINFEELLPEEEQILSILKQEEDGLHVNLLVMQLEMAYSDVIVTLLQMEIKGLIKSLPGGIYKMYNL